RQDSALRAWHAATGLARRSQERISRAACGMSAEARPGLLPRTAPATRSKSEMLQLTTRHRQSLEPCRAPADPIRNCWLARDTRAGQKTRLAHRLPAGLRVSRLVSSAILGWRRIQDADEPESVAACIARCIVALRQMLAARAAEPHSESARSAREETHHKKRTAPGTKRRTLAQTSSGDGSPESLPSKKAVAVSPLCSQSAECRAVTPYDDSVVPNSTPGRLAGQSPSAIFFLHQLNYSN